MDTMNTTGIPAPQTAIPETTTANANPAKRLADAIETVLRANGGKAMGATEISEALVDQGLWPKESKDLSKATWNALRGEINKGEVSRFVKVEGQKGKYAIKG